MEHNITFKIIYRVNTIDVIITVPHPIYKDVVIHAETQITGKK